MADYYKILGVSREASQEEIEKAYRKIVRENHPDLYPGDRKREERLKAANKAYQVLSNPEKRRQYDRSVRILKKPPQDSNTRNKKEGSRSGGSRTPTDTSRLHEVFTAMMTPSATSSAEATPSAGKASKRYHLWISEAEAHSGAVRRIQIDDQTISIVIRPGAKDKDLTQIPVVIRIRKSQQDS